MTKQQVYATGHRERGRAALLAVLAALLAIGCSASATPPTSRPDRPEPTVQTTAPDPDYSDDVETADPAPSFEVGDPFFGRDDWSVEVTNVGTRRGTGRLQCEFDYSLSVGSFPLDLGVTIEPGESETLNLRELVERSGLYDSRFVAVNACHIPESTVTAR